MSKSFRRHVAALAAITICGSCTSFRTTRVTADLSSSAIRLTNGTSELAIMPATGRIVRYGFVGGQNVLWGDPAVPLVGGGWRNFGGSKVWLWPQSEWKSVTGKEWPPPGDPAGEPFVASPIANGVRLTGPAVEAFGLRVVRDISLAPSGSDVKIVERLEPTANGPRAKAGAWSIAQVPQSAKIVVYGAATDTPVPAGLSRVATVITENGLQVVPKAESSKGFFDATRIDATLADGTVFTQLSDSSTSPAHDGQCQVYVEGNTSPLNSVRTRYTELEFASPPSMGNSTLTLHWSLRRPK